MYISYYNDKGRQIVWHFRAIVFFDTYLHQRCATLHFAAVGEKKK